MKKLLIILLSAVMLFCGCGAKKEIIGTIDPGEELPKPESVPTAPYGSLPDIEGMVIDGKLSESVWSGKKFLSAENEELGVKYSFTAFLSEEGMYIGAYSVDPTVVYYGINHFDWNTFMSFSVRGAVGTKTLRIDAKNLRPTSVCVNARSSYTGKLNDTGESEGMCAEMYITWEELGFNEKPAEISVYSYYNFREQVYYLTKYLYPTGGSGKYVAFDADGAKS